ncbi:hypothetical protein ES705_09930 [subsurface metagenome]
MPFPFLEGIVGMFNLPLLLRSTLILTPDKSTPTITICLLNKGNNFKLRVVLSICIKDPGLNPCKLDSTMSSIVMPIFNPILKPTSPISTGRWILSEMAFSAMFWIVSGVKNVLIVK